MDYTPTMALTSLTPTYLKDNYLTGLVITGVDGAELPDTFYEEHLRNAVAKVEQATHVDVSQHVVTSERHDYRVDDYCAYGFIQLFRTPAVSVQQVRAVYPTGQTIQVFPTEWVRLESQHSQIHLVPTSGTLSQVIIGQGADYLPLIFSGLGYLPHLWEVDYTSGFTQTAIPRMVIEALAKVACIDLLRVASNLVAPPGVTSESLGIDGLSQSRGRALPAFKATIDEYKSDLGLPYAPANGLLQQIRQTYLGIPLASV